MTYYGTKHGEGVKRTRKAIEEKRPFKAGGKTNVTAPGAGFYEVYSMAGAQELGEHGIGLDRMGRLPNEWKRRILQDNPNYFVTSFGTPIAWYVPFKGWYIPDVKYSVTTSNHQSQVRYAVGEYTVN